MSYMLRTLLLGPAFLIQGLAVRARVPRLPEPPGNRQGQQGNGSSLSLLIIGDSAAAGVGAAHQDEALVGQLVSKLSPHYEVSWDLQAQTGDTTAGAIARLDAMVPRHFDVAVTSLGVNDVTNMVRLGDWLRQQKQLRSVLRNKFSANRIIFRGCRRCMLSRRCHSRCAGTLAAGPRSSIVHFGQVFRQSAIQHSWTSGLRRIRP